MNNNQKFGKWGEAMAADYLISKGYEILFRNWHSSYGELDLIAKKGNTISIIEVKTRRSRSLGFPEESVTPRKQEHLINATQEFFSENEEFESCVWQIDVIAILTAESNGKPVEIRHFVNAVAG